MQLTEDVMTWNTSDVKKRTPHNRYLYINARGSNFESFKACKRRQSALHSRSRVVRSSSKCRDNMRQMWPLWSLRPGMDRASKVLTVGYFNEDKVMWPVHFELEWAYNWATQQGGVVKAGANAAYRQRGHISFSETHGSWHPVMWCDFTRIGRPTTKTKTTKKNTKKLVNGTKKKHSGVLLHARCIVQCND